MIYSQVNVYVIRKKEKICLKLKTLLKEKKFRQHGHKEGALRAMQNLEDDELGRLEENGTKGSVQVSILQPGPGA